MNNNYRLQLRHGAEGNNFSTRNDVFAYIDGQLQYGGVSLLPYEPILFYYGEDEKNTIIMVGLPEGKTNNGKSYFIIDTADLKEQIDTIDDKYYAKIEELKAKDAELQKAIETETEERKTADEEEAKAREEKDAELEKAIEDETEARTKKDEELQEELDFTKDDIKSVIEACGLIYNKKLADDRVSYEPDSHDEVIRDATDITEAIDKVSKFATKLANDLKISVSDTDTVSLTIAPNEREGGNTITADVNVAGTEGLSKKNYDNNIIGKTAEGLYASASLEPSTSNPNKLIFKTSGYVNGVFKVDAFEAEVDLTAYKGDSGKSTGVTVNVDTNENKISAQLNLSSDNNNILKLEDGEYVVEGTSKNITYKDGTVFSALNEQSNRIEEIEDNIEFVKSVKVQGDETSTSIVNVDKSSKGDFTVTTDVKLSNDNSIIISNGGLSSNIKVNWNAVTASLIITVGNNSYPIDLSELAVSVLHDARYDQSSEMLVLDFQLGDRTKTVKIPVSDLVHDVEVDDTDTIDMSLRSVTGGPNHISADVKIDNTHSDNILTTTSNGLYVSKAYITEAVNEEANTRKAADDEIKASLANLSELANSNKEAIVAEASTARAAEKANADAIGAEVGRAKAAEQANANSIAENKTAIKANEVAIGAEVGRAKAAEQANAIAITAEETRAIAAETKNASDINAEITRATEKEADLLGKIGDNTEKISENKSAIASEVERATKAEKEIDDKAVANNAAINAEVTRATAAESANATAIATEETRAITAEGELKTDIDKNKADIANVKTVADKAASDLSVEVSRAKAAETANATAIMTEKERAEHVESDLLAKTQENSNNIATLTSEIGNIELRKEGDLSYALYVNGTKHGELTIPKDQFLKSVTYDSTTKELVFVFDTISGDITARISIADLVDIYTAGEGLSLNGNAFSVDFSKVANVNSVYTKSEIDEKVSVLSKTDDVKNELDKKLDSILASETYATKDSLYALDNVSAKKEDVNAELEKKLDSELAVQTYATKNELNTHIQYALTNYVTKSEIKPGLDDTNIQEALKNYATKSDLTLGLSTKLDSEIAEQTYETKSNASATYATKLDVNNKLDSTLASETYATKTSLEEVKTNYATKLELSNGLNSKANIVDVYTREEILDKLNEKLNISDAQSTYATIDYVNTNNTNLGSRISNNETSIDNFNLTYNEENSELTYTDKNGHQTVYKLHSSSLIKKGEFNAETNSIILTIENNGVESQIIIPVSDLVGDLNERVTSNTNSIAAINDALGKTTNDIAKEVADRQAAINALDVESNTVDGTNVHITYKEENGIVTVEGVTEDYATVTRTATTSQDTDPKTDALLTVANATKLTTGSDIEKVAAYADDKVKEEMNRVDKKISNLSGDVTSDDNTFVTVEVKTTAGEVSDVIVTQDIQAVASANASNTGLAEASNVKDYVDSKSAAASSTVTQKAGVTVTPVTSDIDGHVEYQVASNLIFEYNPSVASSEGVVATPATITLKSAVREGEVQQTYGTVNVSDIIGSGMLESGSYSSKTGLLTLVFNTLPGETNTVEIDLASLLDIDDMIVGTDSQKYFEIKTVTTEGDVNNFQLDVKVKNVADATSGVTGLADAFEVKTYVDTKVSAEAAECTAKIEDAIKALDVTDTAVDNQYISKVDEVDGKVQVTRTALPVISVASDNSSVNVTNTNGAVNVRVNIDDNSIKISNANGHVGQLTVGTIDCGLY